MTIFMRRCEKQRNTFCILLVLKSEWRQSMFIFMVHGTLDDYTIIFFGKHSVISQTDRSQTDLSSSSLNSCIKKPERRGHIVDKRLGKTEIRWYKIRSQGTLQGKH